MNRNLRLLGASLAASLLIMGLAGCELPGAAGGQDKGGQQDQGDQQNQTPKNVHEGTISQNETWKKADGPHLVKGVLYVEADQGATLTIEAGTEVRFEPGAALYVGHNGRGVLKAIGTQDARILFTSAASNPAKGDWMHIYMGDGAASSVMDYCTIQYAGKAAHAALTVVGKDNTPIITNSTFEQSAGYAIELQQDAAFKVFKDNTIKTSGSNPIFLGANEVGSIGTGNAFVDNTHQAVFVEGETIDKDAVWPGLEIPYRLDGTTYVESANGAVLTLEAGSTLEFTTGASFYVGHNAKGALYAVGTAEKPISFMSVDLDPAPWGGIYMFSGTTPGVDGNVRTTVLKHVVMTYGETSHASMLHLNEAKPFLENVKFGHVGDSSSQASFAISAEGDASKLPLKADLLDAAKAITFLTKGLADGHLDYANVEIEP